MLACSTRLLRRHDLHRSQPRPEHPVDLDRDGCLAVLAERIWAELFPAASTDPSFDEHAGDHCSDHATTPRNGTRYWSRPGWVRPVAVLLPVDPAGAGSCEHGAIAVLFCAAASLRSALKEEMLSPAKVAKGRAGASVSRPGGGSIWSPDRAPDLRVADPNRRGHAPRALHDSIHVACRGSDAMTVEESSETRHRSFIW